MILFYDACAVIYQVELKAPWYQRLQGFATRTRAANPDAQIAISALSLMECRVQPLYSNQLSWAKASFGLQISFLTRDMEKIRLIAVCLKVICRFVAIWLSL